jgi:hypothetical protein
MTPQEREMVEALFERLASVENNGRDSDAERVITGGLKRAPNAIYALVQTVLVQDEALKRADARIKELTGDDGNTQARTSFLDNMRSALGGRTSVPSVSASTHKTGDAPDSRWNQGAAYGGPNVAANTPPQQNTGSSFLGTAAASAAGAIGGALLLNSISSMFGHHGGGGSAFAATPPASPWDNSANSDLARDAGLNDIGSAHNDLHDAAKSAGLFDIDSTDDFNAGDADDFGGDFGGDDSV